MRGGAAALVAVGAAGVAAAVWGVGIERHLYTVRRAGVAALPAGAKPVRVLHISDAHLAPWQHRKQRWIASLAELEPDLVINTGDNLGHPDALAGLQAALEPFAGIPGAFVYGSNDKYAATPRNPFRYFKEPSAADATVSLDTQALHRLFTEGLGWANLNNATARLTAAGQTLELFGVDDAHRDWDDIPAIAGQLASKRRGNSPIARIGVTHAPYRRILDSFVELGAAAIFAGHTHGGQVCLPGYGALVANCDIPLKQAKGLSHWQHAGRSIPLNVSAGIGHSIYAPVRFACRPEATLITLTAKGPSS
jgi:predicted MPP superfamily phosphohydrolase